MLIKKAGQTSTGIVENPNSLVFFGRNHLKSWQHPLRFPTPSWPNPGPAEIMAPGAGLVAAAAAACADAGML